MWHAAVLVATVVLSTGCVAPVDCTSINEEELFNIELELKFENEFERAVHHRHHRRYHHHRHRRHRRNPFLHRLAASALLEAPDQDLVAVPRNHPAVAKKLQGMERQMHELSDRHHVAAQARVNLEGEVSKALHHVNDAVQIKIQLAHAEAQIRAEESKLKRLELDRVRLDRTHHSLVSSLHHIMEPKIEFAKVRLDHQKEDLRKGKAAAAAWKNKEIQFHHSSLAMIEKRDLSKQHMDEAAAAEEKAHNERIVAEKELKDAKKDLNINIQSYQYSQAHLRGAATKEGEENEETQKAEASLKRLTEILGMEQARVDESMAIGKDRLQGKIRRVESNEKNNHEKVDGLKQEYKEWETVSHGYDNQLDSSHHRTSAAARNYAEARKAVLETATSQVASDAQEDSDWAWDNSDWAWALLQERGLSE